MNVRGAIMSLLKPAYYRLPANFCYGPRFAPTLKLLEESQRWDEDRLIEYQISKLQVMLRHCAKHVPYYRRIFREAGFDPGSFRRLSDLRALPLLDKETIRSRPEDFLADNIGRRQMIYFTTGGTMGQPLGLYNLKPNVGLEKAFIYTLWARVGFRHSDRRAILRGSAVKNRPRWKYEPSERAFVFSNFHMTSENVAQYARVIREKKLPYLHAYPSAVIDFARLLKEPDVEPLNFKAILAASENIYPGQREFIESFFGTRFFSW